MVTSGNYAMRLGAGNRHGLRAIGQVKASKRCWRALTKIGDCGQYALPAKPASRRFIDPKSRAMKGRYGNLDAP